MTAARKPRDAAGLILFKDSETGPMVLMGRRHAYARFMPGVYVFPGGGLDPADRQPSGLPEHFDTPHPGLDTFSRSHHNALARAALRELYEETGFLLVQAGESNGDFLGNGVAWQAYARAGFIPAFRSLSLIARAITPAGLPIRFHTRFFLVSGDAQPRKAGGGDGELEDIGWQPADKVLVDLPAPGITKKVLREALEARKAPARFAPVRFTARGKRLYIRQQTSNLGA